jgi:hypothetical protein
MGITIVLMILLVIALIAAAYRSGKKDGDLEGYKRGSEDGYANGRIALVREQTAAKAKAEAEKPDAGELASAAGVQTTGNTSHKPDRSNRGNRRR